jgi:hypothetical protein
MRDRTSKPELLLGLMSLKLQLNIIIDLHKSLCFCLLSMCPHQLCS